MTDIEKWLNGERDYEEGVTLFARHSRNKHLARMFVNGASQFHHEKLVYELTKIKGTTAAVKNTPKTAIKAPKRSKTGAKSTNANEELPAAILAAKKEIVHLYNTIDQEHNRLYDLGTSNDEKTVAKRKRILQKRLPLIARCEELYELKEEYFRTEGATQKEVLDRITEMLKESIPQEQPTNNDDGQLANRVASLSDLQLIKRQKQLASSITKTQNMIQYQSITKLEEAAPLPEGPKRDQLTNKLTALKAEYNCVINELKNRQQA